MTDQEIIEEHYDEIQQKMEEAEMWECFKSELCELLIIILK